MALSADSMAVLEYLSSKQNDFDDRMLPDERQREFLTREVELAGTGPEVASVENFSLRSHERDVAARVYWPGTTRALPVLIWFHGGGFVAGDLEGNDTACRMLCTQSNCVVVNANYALAPLAPFPAALEDANKVVEWVLQSADQLRVDPESLALGGSSAGGNLAVNAALNLADSGPLPQYLLLVYPWLDLSLSGSTYGTYADGYYTTYDKLDWARRQYAPDECLWSDPKVSPLFASRLSALPPSHLVAAEFDPIRSDAEHLTTLLEQAKRPVCYSLYPGTLHGFFQQAKAIAAARAAIDHAAAKLQQALHVI